MVALFTTFEPKAWKAAHTCAEIVNVAPGVRPLNVNDPDEDETAELLEPSMFWL